MPFLSAVRIVTVSLPGWVSSVVLALLAMPTEVGAWGAQGHRLIAEYAHCHLSADARAEIERLLALEPGATMESISTWADETRSPYTAAWHYVNLPRDADCRYEPSRSCVAGNCVVGSIERQTALLASNAPDESRLKALKYLVHLVADVHQPLHAGFANDRGGNTYQVQTYGRGTNLHAIWDSVLIAQWPGGMPALHSAMAGQAPALPAGPASAAEESCRIVSAADFYPTEHKLDDEYLRRWGATLVQRLSAAGARLAALLNHTLSERH